MNIRDRHAVHHAAGRSLAEAKGDPQKILLIYLGIITALSLAASAVSVFLSDMIADTGGLRNIGLRSMLSTGKSILPIIQSVILLGLQIGYGTMALKISRGEEVSTDTLFGGFRRFVPMVGATLMQGAIYMVTAIMTFYASIFIFLMLPLSEGFYAQAMPLMESAADPASAMLAMDEAAMLAMADSLVPMMWIFAGLYLILFIPMHYQFRMVLYRIVDHPHPRAMRAVSESRFLMRRNRFALFRLDLDFWWYYGLQALIAAVCYGDVVLELAGITLPWSSTASFFIFLLLSLALQFVTCYFFMNRVAVTYAVAYGALLPKKEPEEEPAPPANPWQNQY